MTDTDTSFRLLCTWAAASLEPGTALLGLALETRGPSFPPAGADRLCLPHSCQHLLLTLAGHRPGDRNEQNNPGMEENRICPFRFMYQAIGQIMTIMGTHSRASQWNQWPSFALKMGNIFIWHKPTEPDLVCCIYFRGAPPKTTAICLSSVPNKRVLQSIPWILKLCCSTTDDQVIGKTTLSQTPESQHWFLGTINVRKHWVLLEIITRNISESPQQGRCATEAASQCPETLLPLSCNISYELISPHMKTITLL